MLNPTSAEPLPITEQVVTALRDRAAKGLAEYGRPVQAFSGENWQQHLLEELLDGAQYLVAEIEERRLIHDAISALVAARKDGDLAGVLAAIDLLERLVLRPR